MISYPPASCWLLLKSYTISDKIETLNIIRDKQANLLYIELNQ